jgi:hypothetical protein
MVTVRPVLKPEGEWAGGWGRITRDSDRATIRDTRPEPTRDGRGSRSRRLLPRDRATAPRALLGSHEGDAPRQARPGESPARNRVSGLSGTPRRLILEAATASVWRLFG